MIQRLWDILMCRFIAKRCTWSRPATRDLVSDMQSLSKSVDMQTWEMKRHRQQVETGDFLVDGIIGGFPRPSFKKDGER